MENPLLIYDGYCRFCRSWVRYWQRLVGAAVQFEPYQKAAARITDISTEQFAQSIWFIGTDGQKYQGAAASFQVLRYAQGKSHWWWLYQHFPGFAWLSQCIYRFVANHRRFAYWGQRQLWGARLYPEHYHKTSWLFLRALAVLLFFAFASFYSQALGLIGKSGLLPLQDYLILLKDNNLGFSEAPMLFWWDASDWAIEAVSLVGMLASLLLLFNLLPLVCLIVCYFCYLSLVHGGQVFMQFQWDLLLLEVTVAAMLLSKGYHAGIWLMRLLLFRFVFLSGVVKVTSGDVSWASLSALFYYFETQPLPTPLAWYAHQLPDWTLQALTLMVLFIELVLVWLIWLPRRPRQLAAIGIVALQFGILLTGNFGFFNLLTLALCLFLFDDRALHHLVPPFINHDLLPERRWLTWLRCAGVSVLMVLGLTYLYQGLHLQPPGPAISALIRHIQPFALVNPYGVFAVMTTTRNEIVLEGSHDGETWIAYDFTYKPDTATQQPSWNIPHQPRLDWQLWFAALDKDNPPPWFRNLLIRLLFNHPQALSLIKTNPFADEAPTQLRARLVNYRYTSWDEKEKTGKWWNTEEVGIYYPAVQFKVSATPIAPE
ncbi:lipase maturation factor family protein [Aliiglaciecola sp. CAU 1673]|uniref:lipase maturation factor family protein n=1 Tax=Aliiglaciecola sp. CAU 1673 TaxID=3032595 RepID=UPI0023DCBEE8|nr:lipase maturation factor family protein [Aliiglaciecola sp. CAU 1673]MDF2178383.1 lipase maturation factor family protein [Aliiglaciecola sp. CAU 1673]